MSNIIIFFLLLIIILSYNENNNIEGYIESSIVPYNNILNLVDIVYVISIPKRVNYMKKVLKHYNIEAKFIKPFFLKDNLDINKLIEKKLLKKKLS